MDNEYAKLGNLKFNKNISSNHEKVVYEMPYCLLDIEMGEMNVIKSGEYAKNYEANFILGLLRVSNKKIKLKFRWR